MKKKVCSADNSLRTEKVNHTRKHEMKHQEHFDQLMLENINKQNHSKENEGYL